MAAESVTVGGTVRPPLENLLGHQAIALALVESGVDMVFGLMGEANLAWVTSYVDEFAGRFVASRHEAGAVSMAAGAQRMNGGVTVCTLTHGPGVMNGLCALKAAVDVRAAVVLVTATTPIADPHHLQRADHRLLAEAAGAAYLRPMGAEDLVGALRDSLVRAYQLRRPHLIDVPIELLYQRADWFSGIGGVDLALTDHASTDGSEPPPDLAAAYALIAGSKRPLVLAGQGICLAGQEASASALARQLGAPLVTTLAARGACADDPVCLGAVGGYGAVAANRAAQDCDVVVALGAGLNRYTTDEGQLFGEARVIQVDTDVNAFGRYGRTPDVAVLSNLGYVVPRLVPEGEPREPWHRPTRPAEMDRVDALDAGLDPRKVMQVLDRCLPEGRRVVVDGGHCAEWPSRYLRVASSGRFLQANGAGAIGHALGLAIGASLDPSPGPVVAVLGDGALMMSLAELDTAVRVGGGLLIVVLDDEAYAAEVHRLHSLGLAGDTAIFPSASSAAVMEAVGGVGVCVPDLETLEAVVGGWNGEHPLLLEIPLSRAVVSRRLDPESGVI